MRLKTKGGQSAAFAVFILPRAQSISILQILPRQVPKNRSLPFPADYCQDYVNAAFSAYRAILLFYVLKRNLHAVIHRSSLLGSPTYFADVTSELKALIDRAGFVALANGGAFSGKIGAAVVAVRRGGGTHVFDSINHMFLISSMIVPGSLYWDLGVGRDKGEVLGDDEAL